MFVAKNIQTHTKGLKYPVSFIKETAHTSSDDNGANRILWLPPRSDIMLQNVCLFRGDLLHGGVRGEEKMPGS